MKTSVDTSLFIWSWGSLIDDSQSDPVPWIVFHPQAECMKHPAEDSYLLAPSPSAFSGELIKQARFSPLAHDRCGITVQVRIMLLPASLWACNSALSFRTASTVTRGRLRDTRVRLYVVWDTGSYAGR